MLDLKRVLEEKSDYYNNISFIESDPISIPHRFKIKEDIEISGFLTSIISWGNRKAIIKSATVMMDLMDNEPFNFITTAKEKEFKRFNKFVYRTFNSDDMLFFIYAMRNIYNNKGGLEVIANYAFENYGNIKSVIVELRRNMLETSHMQRSEKHLANPDKGSAAKRINMFLRWMVRNDGKGVDFGLWKNIPSFALMCPLDVHSGNIARKLGLLSRKQNDWKAVEELTENLRKFDNIDPVKYDYALFGLGVFKDFEKL
jgi:uncharacterized protein (TIGR02757 family)